MSVLDDNIALANFAKTSIIFLQFDSNEIIDLEWEAK